MAAFAPHCAHTRLPRTLAPLLRAAGLAVDAVTYFSIINATQYDGCYSKMLVPFILTYVDSQGTVPADILKAWSQEQAELNARGTYFFSTGRFNFSIRKPR